MSRLGTRLYRLWFINLSDLQFIKSRFVNRKQTVAKNCVKDTHIDAVNLPIPGQSHPSCVSFTFHRLEKVVASDAVIVTVIAVLPLKSTKMVCPVRSPQRTGTAVLPPVTVMESVTQLPSPSGWAVVKSKKSIRSWNQILISFWAGCDTHLFIT